MVSPDDLYSIYRKDIDGKLPLEDFTTPAE